MGHVREELSEFVEKLSAWTDIYVARILMRLLASRSLALSMADQGIFKQIAGNP